MIRALRQRHRRTFAVLSASLPLVFAAALMARPEGMDSVPLPATFRPPTLETPSLPWPGTSPVLGDGFATVTGYRVDEGKLWLDLDIGELPAFPGLILYWLPSAVETGAALPDGARLVQPLASHVQRSVPLTPAALQADGWLALYSLGHQQIIATPTTLDSAALREAVTRDAELRDASLRDAGGAGR
jgi:hypothetical protein